MAGLGFSEIEAETKVLKLMMYFVISYIFSSFFNPLKKKKGPFLFGWAENFPAPPHICLRLTYANCSQG